MLRQGWEAKIKRPLTLVVADEAHNIQSPQRGLKLELVATINKECAKAQFLLLTPLLRMLVKLPVGWVDRTLTI